MQLENSTHFSPSTKIFSFYTIIIKIAEVSREDFFFNACKLDPSK